MRFDLWLKYVCLYKHRSEATEACRGGLVKLNGERVKPAADVHVGDVVEISGERLRKYVVLAVPGRQASKQEAREMIRDESPPPEPRPAPLVERDRGAGRPTKRERREIEKWRRG